MAAAAARVYNRAETDQRRFTEVRVPFRGLLKQLVEGVEGASGAILLESAGEAVQWHAADESRAERLRLRSAYVAVVLQNSQTVAARTDAGRVAYLVLQYDGASFVAAAVERDYFVVLELSPAANVAQAIYRLQGAIEGLRRAMAQ
jgi:predicted regulator of Ras-like GTPase activity (Roadblock/LC7/MglB family)